MALYSYKAVDASGKSATGLHEAGNLAELEFHLERSKLYLVRAKECGKGRASHWRKIRRRDLITFFFNLEHLFRSGIPLLECLGDLRDSMDERQFSRVINGMVESIENGATLSQAMAQHPQSFDAILVSLVYAGETSGRLPEAFVHITESLKWQDEMTAQTRNMLLYPAFAGTLVVALTFFLLAYLVPQLAGFIKGMGREIPWQTRLLLEISSAVVNYWHIMLALPLILFTAIRLASRYHGGLQYRMDALKLRLWPTGPILRKIILARFANAFAMMYASGIGILECITHTRDLAGNLAVAASLEQAAHEIEAGRNLTQSFQATGIFPPLVIRMLRMGEATGQLDAALRNVGYFYDRDVRESVRRMQALIEPSLTVLLGILLGCVMLSTLSPIYDIIGKVNL